MTATVFDGSAAAGPTRVEHLAACGSTDSSTKSPGTRSTLIFVNSRRLAERLTPHSTSDGANAVSPRSLARAHHGSVSREQREIIEEDLKSGRLPAVVATSSMELGIDMGAIDLVVQVESPPSVASGLQRVGRAGHQVGAISQGSSSPIPRRPPAGGRDRRAHESRCDRGTRTCPRTRWMSSRSRSIAMVAMDDWHVENRWMLIRSHAHPFARWARSPGGRYSTCWPVSIPGEEFAELRPRLVWDRPTGALTARPGSQRLAVTSGGTIPDRGLFGVFLVGTSMRVGELDEEMVYESRVGDLFALGASSWRIEDITADRVWVSPAPGEIARMPFWRGDRPAAPGVGGRGRPFHPFDGPGDRRSRLLDVGLDEFAADNLLAYITEQRHATGALPDDRTVLVERFRDELGDWRVVVHTPFRSPGARPVGSGTHCPTPPVNTMSKPR